METAVRTERCSKPFSADPHSIRCYVVVVPEDQTGSHINNPNSTLLAPVAEKTYKLGTHKLMVPVRLLRHVKLPVYDFIALAIIRQHCEICGCPAQCGVHKSPRSLFEAIVRS